MARIAAVALACTMVPLAATAEVCPPEPGETVRVVDVIDGDTLRLEDGRELRLVSLLAPKAEPGMSSKTIEKLAEETRSALSEAVLGHELGLSFAGQREDRHGRLLAHAFVDGDPKRWLQRDIIAQGLARAYPVNDNYGCVRELLDNEAAARGAKLGLWSSELGTIGDAERPEYLKSGVGRFAIVEGRVKSVGDRPKLVYLNFGTNWSEDFTVFVDRGDRAGFDRADIDLNALEGRRVRVRGWILDDRGPAIHMTRPEQLEIVDAR